MKRVYLFVLFAILAFGAGCSTQINDFSNDKTLSDMTRAWEQNYSSGYRYYTSMKKVDDLNGNVSSISPAIDNNKIPYGTAADYLEDTSCLGYYGPMSAYGPLSTLGPIGSNAWNPSYWISAWMDWSNWSDDIQGPLGYSGPLGENGPLSEYYSGSIFTTNDFARHSRALGVWTPLGPVGPMGALGALGPLGPVGSHGYTTNANGQYLSGTTVKRSVTMWYNAAQTISRTYDLYENYTESFAKSMTNNDTSFMVHGVSSSYSDEDVYTFKSAVNQVVTIVVVNEKELDDFDLTILNSSNTVIATSDEGRYFVDWVQLKVPANTTIKAKVKLYWSGHYLSSSYRLYVTGSTQYANQTEITGNHIGNW